MSTYCGTIASDGQITCTKSKFSCAYDSDQKKYTVDYNGHVESPNMAVVSPTLQTPGLSNILYTYTGGFTVQVFQNVDGVYTPVSSSVNFIVKEIE
ncbi:hypothetical protein IMCC3317_01790 [Kordia antarctica]|uniref:Uncharacterized protein n=1 Tax=Kordia antarctica TaxID=1218801 RepID=A0A7L4ZDU2_9FLAO|nr:hypothetical protein [Kordia antarctica]QHI34835.1 hypothetical protein IMCC3317_01790 [Kordia antarctica]